MNTCIKIFIVISIFSIVSCNQNRYDKSKASGTTSTQYKVGEDDEGIRKQVITTEDIISMDSLYEKMPVLSLPFRYEDHLFMSSASLIPLPEDMFDLFHNFDSFDNGTKISKLPVKGLFKPVIVFYHDDRANPRVNLYTLSDSMKIIDRLQIYSVEEINGKEVVIEQKFEIPEDYRIRVSKHLNGLLIEELHYTLDDHRCFMEIRDGKTPAIAYESPDSLQYKVESFIWDHNARGTLYKKDLKQKFYRIGKDYKVNEIKESEYI